MSEALTPLKRVLMVFSILSDVSIPGRAASDWEAFQTLSAWPFAAPKHCDIVCHADINSHFLLPGSAETRSVLELHSTHAHSAEAEAARASEQHRASTMDRQCLLIAPPCPSLRVPASTPHRMRRASLGSASLAWKCPPQGANNQYARGLTPLLRVLVQILRHYQREPNTHVAGPT